MPRYRFETAPVTEDVRTAARALAATRFPELSIEHASTGPTADRWECRAPSEAHVQRWADASHLVLESLRPVEAADEHHTDSISTVVHASHDAI
jgi:hypothetical protein